MPTKKVRAVKAKTIKVAKVKQVKKVVKKATKRAKRVKKVVVIPSFKELFPDKPKEKGIIKIPIKSDTIKIASFDPGKVNLAYYVEETSLKVLKKLRDIYSKLPKKMQRRVKGPMNVQVTKILQTLYKTGKRISQDVVDVRDDKTSQTLDIQTRKNIIHLLELKRMLWMSCDIIVIEKQFFNKKMANVDAIKIAEIIMTWFLDNFPEKIIQDFNAAFKTYVLGAPKMTKTARKKWAIAKGKYIYEIRGDIEGTENMERRVNAKGRVQKSDDVFDCVIMCQAYKYLTFVAPN